MDSLKKFCEKKQITTRNLKSLEKKILDNSKSRLKPLSLYSVGGAGVDPLTTLWKQANADSTKNVLLLKNPQFLPNHNETL